MNLILARHGNTFGPNDPVVWAGSQNDLPLVKEGISQAEKLAEAFIIQKFIPSAIYSSPLLRTREFAEIIARKLNLSVSFTVDPRLNEIDYGQWTGLTNEQITCRFGRAALEAWNHNCIWPDEGNWGETPQKVAEEVISFIRDLSTKHAENEKILVITSNGRLRYFLALNPLEFKIRIVERNFKVKTGHICKIYVQKEQASIPLWNISAEDLIQFKYFL